MLTIPILANNIICDNLYYVNILKNTHITAYSKTHIHTPPQNFHPIMDKFHTIGKKKTRGYVCQEIGIQNIKGWERNKYHMIIHYQDNEIHT